MDYGIDPMLVGYSMVPHITTTYSPIQLIQKTTTQKVVQSWSSLFQFLVPSTGFMMLALAGFLLYWTFPALLYRFKKFARLPPRMNLQTKIVSLFFLLFLFIMGQLFQSSLNTSNVVVRTDQLLYSKDQLLKTEKEFCFVEKGGEVEYLKNAPASSLLRKLYEKRNESNNCYLLVGNQVGNIYEKDLTQIFTIAPQVMLTFMTRAVQSFLRSSTYMEERLEIYQSIRSLLINRQMKIAKKNYLDKCLRAFVEGGFSIKFSRTDPPPYSGMKFEPRGDHMHFDSLQAFIKGHTLVKALSFDKLDHLFRIYFASISIMLFLNLAHYSIKTTGFRRLRRRTKRNLTKLTRLIRMLLLHFYFKVFGWFALLKLLLSSLFTALRRIRLRR